MELLDNNDDSIWLMHGAVGTGPNLLNPCNTVVELKCTASKASKGTSTLDGPINDMKDSNQQERLRNNVKPDKATLRTEAANLEQPEPCDDRGVPKRTKSIVSNGNLMQAAPIEESNELAHTWLLNIVGDLVVEKSGVGDEEPSQAQFFNGADGAK